MKKSILFFVALSAATLSFAVAPTTSCPAPQNVSKVAQSSGSISFDWDDADANPTFEVYFVKDGSASPVYQTSSSAITFNNLEPGNYEFHFRADCGAGVSAEIVITDIVEM